MLFIASLLILLPLTLSKTHIDLQWAICDEDAETVLQKLGEHGKEPYKVHPISYYDASPPCYTARGVAFRVKVKHNHTISLIKARFDEETQNVPADADCVWDMYGNATYYTCGLASPMDDQVKDMWSGNQVAFAERYHKIDWDSLVAYGPYMNPKWKLQIEGYEAVFDDVNAYVVDSPLHLMEIELEVEKSEGYKVHKKITEYLEDRGVVICDPQLPKSLRLFEELELASPKSEHDWKTGLKR